ncbi:hypothetical protein ACPA9J_09025 [Pseudomonas aeruginosa]
MAGSHELLVTIEENAVMGRRRLGGRRVPRQRGPRSPVACNWACPTTTSNTPSPARCSPNAAWMPRASKRQYASVSTGSSAKPSDNGG